MMKSELLSVCWMMSLLLSLFFGFTPSRGIDDTDTDDDDKDVMMARRKRMWTMRMMMLVRCNKISLLKV